MFGAFNSLLHKEPVMKTFKLKYSFPLLFLIFLINLFNVANAATIPYSSVKIDANSTSDTVTLNGAILQIGNQLLCKNTADYAPCQDPGSTGNTQNNYHTQHRARIDSSVTHSNTMARLVLQPGDNIIFARLYWSARASTATDAESAVARDIKIKGPASSAYTQFTAPVAKHGSEDNDYGASVDVTQYVINNGEGDYYVGDILTASGALGIYASWQLIVVVENTARSLKNMAIYDGFDSIYGSGSNPEEITVDAAGFITPTGSDPFDASLFVYGGETDDGYGDSTWIEDGSGIWRPLVDGQNDTTDVMNASVSSPDYPSGYRDGNSSLATPNYRNVLGVDIDKLQINDKMNSSKQILSNSQTSTRIRLQSTGDLYSLIMFAFETEVFVPKFCYDYAYKQQGKYFTKPNDGSQHPSIVSEPGDVILGSPIEVSIYLKSMVDGTIEIQNMELDVDDINTTQATYITNSTEVAKVGDLTAVPVSAIEGSTGPMDFIHDIPIGTLEQNDYFYAYYSIDPQKTDLDMPINASASYQLVLTGSGAAPVDYKLIISQDIPLCTGGGLDYRPYTGIFNVVHNNYYNNLTQYYNLPTQVTGRAGNFKVITTSEADHDLLEPKSTIVAIDLIDAAAFQTTDASCRELDSAISERVWMIFDNNVSETMFDKTALEASLGLNNTITSAAEFYAEARENAAFRISYNEIRDNNGSLIDHTLLPNGQYIINNFTQLVQNIGACKQPVQYPLGASGNTGTATMVAQACGQSSLTNSISPAFYKSCMECLYGYNTKFVCSRDNFAIRPEAFMIKLNDQNQTNPSVPLVRLADDVSGVTATPSTTQTELAAGYDYNIEVNATNHLNNLASPGYTQYFVTDSSNTLQYTWAPSVYPAICNDTDDHVVGIQSGTVTGFKTVDGYISLDYNLSNVGEYTLTMKDETWTSVDSNISNMAHHSGTYFLNPNTFKDCIVGSSDTQSETATTTNATPLQGCSISSNHDSSGSTLKYRDYNVEFHPYDFNLTIKPTVGLNHTDVNATSFIYMADMHFNSGQDENMSYHLDGNIIAQGYNGIATSNFVESCYAKPLTIAVNKTDTTLNDVNGNPIVYQMRFHDINATGIIISALDVDANDTSPTLPIEVYTTHEYFTKNLNGLMNTRLNLNYNREVNVTANPKEISFSSYDVDCTSAATDCTFNADLINNKTTQGTKDLNSSIAIKHYYGRSHAPRNRFVGPTGNTFIYYEVFCNTTASSVCYKSLLQNGLNSKITDDPRWFKNEAHDVLIHGKAGLIDGSDITQKNGSKVKVTTGATLTNITGRTTVPLTYDATRDYPYKATMENNASKWLIYNKYNSAAIRNEFEVEFVNTNSQWAGKAETTDTTDEVGSKKTNRRSMW